jgi:hypothetical protein
MRIEDLQPARPRPRGQVMRIKDLQPVRPRPRGQVMRIEHIPADLTRPLRPMPHLPSPAREDAGAPVDYPLSSSFFLRQYALLHGQSSGLLQSLALTGLSSM